MKHRSITALVLVVIIGIMSISPALGQEASPAASSSAAATPVASSPSQSLRGLRYCEVLVPEARGARGARDGMAMRVYTTQGLNDCPLNLWDAIDARTEAQRLGVPLVFKNGPRYVAYDQISAQIDGTNESFQGLEMQLVATLELPAGTTPLDRAPYQGMTVARNTEYIYLAGKPVFELIAADGSVYAMQTYVATGPDSGFPDPADVADRLELPSGWEFREAVPDTNLYARTSNGQATVVRDNIGNTYQLLTAGNGTPVPSS